MTDYKAIKGKTVLNLASDLDNAEGEGEIWFNTTSGDFKTIVSAGVWSSGGSLNGTHKNIGGMGIQTAALVAGGYGRSGETEQYDGSAWTEVGDLNENRYGAFTTCRNCYITY